MKIKTFLLLFFLTAPIAILSMDLSSTCDLSTIPPMEWQYAQKLLHYAQDNKKDAFKECIEKKETSAGKEIRHEVLQHYYGNDAPDHYDNIQSNIIAYKDTFADLNKKLLEYTNYHPSLYRNSVHFIKLLLIHGADVNTYAEQDTYKYRPLIYAIGHEDIPMVQLLLSHPQIDPNVMVDEYPAVIHAYIHSNIEVIKLLLAAKNFNVNCSGRARKTILHWAAGKGDTELIKLLLEIPHINPNALDENRNAPIYSAWWNHRAEAVDLLYSYTEFRLTPTCHNVCEAVGILSTLFVGYMVFKK